VPPSLYRCRRANPDGNEAETPFTLKVLSSDPYRNSKARGKPIEFYYDKPHVPKETEIPKNHPAMLTQPETVEEVGLCGGQWQRVALARSFMRIREADLFILYEPSSALDPHAEYEIFKNLLSIRKNKTTIYIVPHPFLISQPLMSVASLAYSSCCL